MKKEIIKKVLSLFLSLIVTGFLSYQVVNQINQKQVLSLQQKIIEIDYGLLLTAKEWAIERGESKMALSSSFQNSIDMIDDIVLHRQKGEDLFVKAVDNISSVLNQDKQIQDFLFQIEDKIQNIKETRMRIDYEVTIDNEQRDDQLLTDSFDGLTKIIKQSQDLRYYIDTKYLIDDKTLDRHAHLQHFLWLMSEYMGQERAMIASILSENRQIPSMRMNVLGKLRGRFDENQDLFNKFLITPSRNLQDKINAMNERIQQFEEIRKQIFTVGAGLSPEYSIKNIEWFEEATQTIEQIYILQKEIFDENKEYIRQKNGDINFMMLVYGLLSMMSLSILIYFLMPFIKVSKERASSVFSKQNLITEI